MAWPFVCRPQTSAVLTWWRRCLKKTSVQAVNEALKAASAGALKGIMGYTTDPVVSVDMNGTNESSIVDSLATMVIGEKMVKVLSWYDNEWGFSNRAVDCLSMLGKAAR